MGAAVLGLLHVVTAPYLWWETAAGLRAVSARGDRIHGILAGELDAGLLAQQRVAVLAAPDPLVGMYTAALDVGVTLSPRGGLPVRLTLH